MIASIAHFIHISRVLFDKIEYSSRENLLIIIIIIIMTTFI